MVGSDLESPGPRRTWSDLPSHDRLRHRGGRASHRALGCPIHDHGLTRLIIVGARQAAAWRDGGPPRAPRAGSGRSRSTVGSWLLLGLHIFALARPLGAGAGDLWLITGGFALAFVAGLVVVPLPAGAGVREAVLVVTVGAALGRPSAITIALLSRFVMIVVELLMATAVGCSGGREVGAEPLAGPRRLTRLGRASPIDPSVSEHLDTAPLDRARPGAAARGCRR